MTLFSDVDLAKYSSVFGLMFLFPSETVMPALGYAAASGNVSLTGAIVAGVAGSVTGSFLVYILSRQLRQATTDQLFLRHGRVIGITSGRVAKAGRWFENHGRMAVFGSRFIPALRTAMCVPAGLAHMPVARFLTYCLLGTLLDSLLLIYLGYRAGDNYAAISAFMGDFVTWGWAVLFGLIVILALLLRARKSHRNHVSQ